MLGRDAIVPREKRRSGFFVTPERRGNVAQQQHSGAIKNCNKKDDKQQRQVTEVSS